MAGRAGRARCQLCAVAPAPSSPGRRTWHSPAGLAASGRRTSPGRGIWGGRFGREPAPRGEDGAAAGECVSLGQDKTYPLAPRDTPGCGGNGVIPKPGRAGGVHGCRQGPGRDKSRLWCCWQQMSPAPCELRRQLGPFPGLRYQRWEPGAQSAACTWWEELQDSNKPSARKEELTKPRPSPAVTRHHQPFGAGDSFSLSWGSGRPVLSEARGRGGLQEQVRGQGDGAELAPPQAPQALEEDPCTDRCPFTNSPTTAGYKAWPAA